MFEQTFKNIDDILHKDAGCGSELDYVEQTSWVLFLKYLDDLEKDKSTAAELTGAKIPDNAGEDSVSLLPDLLGTSTNGTREATVHQSAAGDLAIRQGPWKLIFKKDGSRELYNLARREMNDLARGSGGRSFEAATLADAGLDRVNVSLDSLDAAHFAAITRRGGRAPRIAPCKHGPGPKMQKAQPRWLGKVQKT